MLMKDWELRNCSLKEMERKERKKKKRMAEEETYFLSVNGFMALFHSQWNNK